MPAVRWFPRLPAIGCRRRPRSDRSVGRERPAEGPGEVLRVLGNLAGQMNGRGRSRHGIDRRLDRIRNLGTYLSAVECNFHALAKLILEACRVRTEFSASRARRFRRRRAGLLKLAELVGQVRWRRSRFQCHSGRPVAHALVRACRSSEAASGLSTPSSPAGRRHE